MVYYTIDCVIKITFNLVACNNFIGKPLKKAVNGFRLKKYYSSTVEPPQLLPDSIFQFGSSDSSENQSGSHLSKFQLCACKIIYFMHNI